MTRFAIRKIPQKWNNIILTRIKVWTRSFSLNITNKSPLVKSSSFSLFLVPFSGVGFFLFYFLLMDLLRHLVGLLGQGISPAPRPLSTHRETQTHIHAPSKIRTCDPNVRAAEDSTCLRPRGHWDRPLVKSLWENFTRDCFPCQVLAEILAQRTRVYPKLSELAAWSENYKWYSSLPLDATVSLFCESV
jgi:hypothetical protein